MRADSLLEEIKRNARVMGLVLNDEQTTQLHKYLVLIQKWNKVYNLTAIRNTAEMVTHHLLDCLAVIAPLRNRLAGLAYMDDGAHDVESDVAGGQIGRGGHVPFLYSLLDVGSGAGLPGVVVAICCPDIHVTCIDAVAKKMAFVQQVASELKLPNLCARHIRIETLSEPFDIVVSRAFASLNDFVEGSRAAIKSDSGIWMAMKAKDTSLERQALTADIDVFHVEPLHIPGLDAERHLVWMRQKTA